jgi:hypothetical protein
LATYRHRTGRCASPSFSVARDRTGASCIDMPTACARGES